MKKTEINKVNRVYQFILTGLALASIPVLNSCDNSKTKKENKVEAIVKVEKTEKDTKLDPKIEVLKNLDAFYNPTTGNLGKAIKGYEELGVFVKHQLNDGTDLLVLNNGFEKQLINFIESNKPADKTSWFNMRRVLFQGNTSNIDSCSNEQINNIAKILEVYPNIELRIGGYTNNTDEAFEIAEISSARWRAKALLDALVLKGVKVTRLTSEGYGTKHAIADNSTAEGRALNRRVAARVSKR